MRAIRPGAWLLLSMASTAWANEPLTDFPCTPSMAKRAAASDAELGKRLKQKVTGACLCFLERCERGSVTYDVPVASPTKLALSLQLRREIGPDGDALPAIAAPAPLKAVGERLAAHPLVRALLAEPDAKCSLTPNGETWLVACKGGHWSLALVDDEAPRQKGTRQLLRQEFRLPLAAIAGDPELAVAKKSDSVAQFLAEKGDVVVDYTPIPERRMVFKRGLEFGTHGRETFAASFTVFFTTSDNGWAATTLGVQAACPGEQYVPCK